MIIRLGDLVFIKSESDKHSARDKYIVTSVAEEYLRIKKLTGSQFRTKEYVVRPSDVYLVPGIRETSSANDFHRPCVNDMESDTTDSSDTEFVPSALPTSLVRDSEVSDDSSSPVNSSQFSSAASEISLHESDYSANSEVQSGDDYVQENLQMPHSMHVDSDSDLPDNGQSSTYGRPKRNCQPPQWLKAYDCGDRKKEK